MKHYEVYKFQVLLVIEVELYFSFYFIMKRSVDFEYEAKLLNLREVIQNLVCEKCFGRYSGSHPNENVRYKIEFKIRIFL